MGVDADQLVAGEGSHLHLLTIQGVGRQLGGGVVVAPSILRSIGVPCAGDGGAAAAVLDAGNDVCIRAGLEGGLGAHIQNCLRDIGTGGLVPVADSVDAVIGEGSFQTGTGVEAVNVPCIVQAHHKLLAGGISLGQQGVHALDIVLTQDALVVVEEVAVVGGHGVGVKLAVHGRGLNGASQVAALDILGVQQDLLQGTGCHQLIKLVIRKGENIGSCLGVSQNGILGAGLGLDTDLDRNVALVGILRDESISHLTQHGLVFLSTPHGQFHIAPAFCGGRSLTGGRSGIGLRCGRGRSRGRCSTTAGGQHSGRRHGAHSSKSVMTGNPFFHDRVLLHF